VDADLRASLYVAGAAAATSIVIGAFAGVLFLPLIVRALIGGSLVGALVFGAFALIRRFLPGLLPGQSQDAEATDSVFSSGEGESTAGSRVDIVLPGGDLERSSDLAAEGSPVGGVEEVRAGIEDIDAENAEEISLIDAEEPAGRESAAVSIPPAPSHASSMTESLEDLDVLPDLDGFTDSFAAAEFSSSGGVLPSAKAEEQSSPRVSDGLDPATLAKAVRTILKRDQKG
jgi:hypothetical protein